MIAQHDVRLLLADVHRALVTKGKVAVSHRDLEGLRAEVDFERAIAAAQERGRLLG
jgi:hypothetical protein